MNYDDKIKIVLLTEFFHDLVVIDDVLLSIQLELRQGVFVVYLNHLDEVLWVNTLGFPRVTPTNPLNCCAHILNVYILFRLNILIS